MKKTILILAALAGAMLWTACQKEEEEIIEEKPEVVPDQPAGSYTLTVEASKGVNTKALSLSGNTLNAYWASGEQVAVYLGGTPLGTLSATADGTDNTKATLSGTLTSVEGVNNGTVLTLLFPRAEWDYTGQDGSAPDESGTLATKYDYALATVTVDAVSGNTVTTTGGASFDNQQSMYRFGFKVGGTGDPIEIKGFTVSSYNDALVRSRIWYGSDWIDDTGPIDVNIAGNGTLTLPYVSLRNMLVSPSNPDDDTIIDTYSFSVIGDDGALYLGHKIIPSKVMNAQGKYIRAQSISVNKADLSASGSALTDTPW